MKAKGPKHERETVMKKLFLVFGWWFVIAGQHPIKIGAFGLLVECEQARMIVKQKFNTTECYHKP